MALITIFYTNKAIFGGFNSESVQYLIENREKENPVYRMGMFCKQIILIVIQKFWLQ
jgi:hypothetical protein